MVRKVLTATYDDNSGELVAVEWAKQFVGETTLMKADVLGDLKGVIDAAYEENRKDAMKGQTPEAMAQLGHPAPPDAIVVVPVPSDDKNIH